MSGHRAAECSGATTPWTLLRVNVLRGVDAQTVRNWIHSGKLPAVSFGPDGTVVRVDPAELARLRQPVVPKTK